jgi:hypothetical protein
MKSLDVDVSDAVDFVAALGVLHEYAVTAATAAATAETLLGGWRSSFLAEAWRELGILLETARQRACLLDQGSTTSGADGACSDRRHTFATPWTIYALCDGDDVYYVGQSWLHPAQRLMQHCLDMTVRGRKESPRVKWLRTLFAEKRMPSLRVLAIHHDELAAARAEGRWIEHFLEHGEPLTNRKLSVSRRTAIRSDRERLAPPQVPPGTPWATPLPGAIVTLPPPVKRRVLMAFAAKRAGKRKRVGAARAARPSTPTLTMVNPVPREAVERARAIRDAMAPTSGRRLSWRRIARRLTSEGLGEHHPGDLAYAVCDLD